MQPQSRTGCYNGAARSNPVTATAATYSLSATPTAVTAGGTITVTWRNGKVAWSWETGFALSGAAESDLTFASETEKFDVQSDGKLDY